MAETPSVVTKERLAKGLSYQAYVASVKTNKELFDDSYAKTSIAEEDKQFFRDLVKKKGPVTVMVLGEDWCPDVYTNVPIVQRIAEAAGEGMELKIFPRDENLDLMNEYLNNTFMSIPTVVFFDQNLNELARWIERSQLATRMATEMREDLAKRGLPQEELRAEYRRRMADAYQTTLRAVTVREIREFLSK